MIPKIRLLTAGLKVRGFRRIGLVSLVLRLKVTAKGAG